MNAWLVYSEMDVKKNQKYIQFYKKEGKIRNIFIELILVEDLVYGIRENTWFLMYQGREVLPPDFIVCRTINPLLNEQFEAMGIPTFNNSKVSFICNDKARTYQYIAHLDIPIVDTRFYKQSYIQQALKSCDCGKYVVKAVAGHGGSQVFLYDADAVNEEKEKQRLLIEKGLDGEDFVLQPFVKGKHQDVRVYVIGKEVIAAILRTASKGFRSNFSLGGNVGIYQLSNQGLTYVNKIIDAFDFGLVGIDFIIDDNGELLFNEIEDVVGARMLYQCTDINLVGRYLDYILEQINL